MMIMYRIVPKSARPDTDWATAVVPSAIQFAPAIDRHSIGGSIDSNKSGGTVTGIDENGAIPTNQ